jgi:uncharacterized lipoprotein YajG
MKLLHGLLCFSLSALILLSACKKSDSGKKVTYPRQVAITYRVTSSATSSLGFITYDNETGGLTSVDNPGLPFTKTVNRTVDRYTIVTMGYFVNPAQPAKMEILVDNKLVMSKENNIPNAAMSYTFE